MRTTRTACLALLLWSTPATAAPTITVTAERVVVDGAPAIPSDLLFELGEPALRPSALPILDAVAKALAADQGAEVVVEVYTDDTAPDNDRTGTYLRKLSQWRADAVRAHLVKRGVRAARIRAQGLATDKPVGDNATEEGKRANRRVELVIKHDVRPAVAADLATYLKGVRGAGPKLLATIATTEGTVRCELFPDRAPATVASFIGLATGQKPWIDPRTNKVMKGKPFYDGLTFHRVIPKFMIQGGDPVGNGTGGPGYKLEDEIAPDLKHQPGSLSMANAGPNTAGSQFFVAEVAASWLDGRFTIFGQCKDVDVIIRIGAVPTGTNNLPVTPVTIKKLTISKGS